MLARLSVAIRNIIGLIELVERIESENGNIYGVYAEITDHYSARNMLQALKAASRERLGKIEQLRRAAPLENLFDAERSTRLGDPGADPDLEYAFDAGMQYVDFLMLICLREEALSDLYNGLASIARDSRTADLLHGLARDCERRRQLARSHYDLETLA